MENTKWFILELPPINLYTANLLQPYWNGVEHIRIRGISQPIEQRTDKINSRLQLMIDQHNSTEKRCIAECKLDKTTQTCLGCKRSIKEITEAGLKAKQERNKQ